MIYNQGTSSRTLRYVYWLFSICPLVPKRRWRRFSIHINAWRAEISMLFKLSRVILQSGEKDNKRKSPQTSLKTCSASQVVRWSSLILTLLSELGSLWRRAAFHRMYAVLCVFPVCNHFPFCWTYSHFHPFRSPVLRHQAFGTLSNLLTCNRMKRQKAAALRTREISRGREGGRECKIEGRMERRRRGEGARSCSVSGGVFYVTAVPYCPQKMSLCPWEAALRGETHLSDRIYRDVLWPDPEEAGRRPTALCLPTNTPSADCFTQNVQ